MQTLPAGWDKARSGRHRMETKVTIDGVEYSERDIKELRTYAAMFTAESVSIGGCVAKEISMTFKQKDTIPRMAEILIYVRPVADAVETDWLPKGVYYIDTREIDYSSGIINIHGYDAMLKSDVDFLNNKSDEAEWPKTMPEVVDEIAERMGISLDDRTVLNDAYKVEYPRSMTMREVLGYIAVAHGGNWIITDSGELYLVPLSLNTPTTEETHGYLVTEDGYAVVFGNTRIITG